MNLHLHLSFSMSNFITVLDHLKLITTSCLMRLLILFILHWFLEFYIYFYFITENAKL